MAMSGSILKAAIKDGATGLRAEIEVEISGALDKVKNDIGTTQAAKDSVVATLIEDLSEAIAEKVADKVANKVVDHITSLAQLATVVSTTVLPGGVIVGPGPPGGPHSNLAPIPATGSGTGAPGSVS